MILSVHRLSGLTAALKALELDFPAVKLYITGVKCNMPEADLEEAIMGHGTAENTDERAVDNLPDDFRQEHTVSSIWPGLILRIEHVGNALVSR